MSKKMFAKLSACALAAACVISAAACAKEEQKNGGEKLYITGSLQTLYGKEEGYPQAVIVAKKSFTSQYPAYTNEFIAKLNNADEYLKTAQPGEIISSIKGKLTEGLTPAFNAKNLTAEVVKNCNVKFIAAQTEKENVKKVLQGMMGTNAPETADEFYYTPSEVNEDSATPEKVTVYSPDGAPALALAQMIKENSEIVSYNVVEASTIQTYVKNADEAKNADFCIMPVNAAAKLLGNGQKYQMLGTVTHGNLFILSKGESDDFKDGEALKALIGKEVGVMQLPNVPGMVFKMILNQYNIPWQEVKNEGEIAADKVNLAAVSDAAQVSADSRFAAFVAAEPLATLRASAK